MRACWNLDSKRRDSFGLSISSRRRNRDQARAGAISEFPDLPGLKRRQNEYPVAGPEVNRFHVPRFPRPISSRPRVPYILLTYLHSVVCYTLYGMGLSRPESLNLAFSETLSDKPNRSLSPCESCSAANHSLRSVSRSLKECSLRDLPHTMPRESRSELSARSRGTRGRRTQVPPSSPGNRFAPRWREWNNSAERQSSQPLKPDRLGRSSAAPHRRNSATSATSNGMAAHMKRNRCRLPAETIIVTFRGARIETMLLDIFLPFS